MERRFLLISLLPTLIAVVLASISGVWALRTTTLPPPFAYLDKNGVPASGAVMLYRPEHDQALCPGQTLRFTLYLAVTDTPVVIAPMVKIMNLATNRAFPGYGPLNPPVPYATPVRLEASIPYVLPTTIVPGLYELQVVAGAEGRDFNGFRVPFVIRADCEVTP